MTTLTAYQQGIWDKHAKGKTWYKLLRHAALQLAILAAGISLFYGVMVDLVWWCSLTLNLFNWFGVLVVAIFGVVLLALKEESQNGPLPQKKIDTANTILDAICPVYQSKLFMAWDIGADWMLFAGLSYAGFTTLAFFHGFSLVIKYAELSGMKHVAWDFCGTLQPPPGSPKTTTASGDEKPPKKYRSIDDA